jgi:hypothetical protein
MNVDLKQFDASSSSTTVGGFIQDSWSIFDKVRVTTVPRVYPTRVVRVDTAYAGKLAAAQKLLAAGKCVNDLLDPVDCSTVRRNLEGK